MSFSAIKNAIPEGVKEKMRPAWYQGQMYVTFFNEGGRISFNTGLNNRVATRMFDDRPMSVVVRSEREFRRWANFGRTEGDVVHEWIANLKDCDVFWDIGSANGLEGFYVNHMHDAKVVFVEPFTPSIETILKTMYIQQQRDPSKKDKFEVVQGMVDEKSGLQRLDMHEMPVPGDTKNSAHDGKDDYCYGGRKDDPVTISQWMASVCLDDLWKKQKLPTPSYVKIDIDGFEMRALKGGKELLNSGEVKGWCIEVNDNNEGKVVPMLEKAGYKKVGEYVHRPDREDSARDFIFEKK